MGKNKKGDKNKKIEIKKSVANKSDAINTKNVKKNISTKNSDFKKKEDNLDKNKRNKKKSKENFKICENSNLESDYQIYVHESFHTMKLKKSLLEGIKAFNYITPTDIQKKAIMPIIDDEDVIIQAKSGSGKTGTFCIGALQRIDESQNVTQVLIISHTRELANQTALVLEGIGSQMSVKGTLCVGGGSNDETVSLLSRLSNGQHVVVGTPGRVLEMVRKERLDLSHLKLLIVDEADQFLSKAFISQLMSVVKCCPAVQTVLVSATMPPEFLECAQMFVVDPVKILAREESLAVRTMGQYYVNVGHPDNKYTALIDIYSNNYFYQTIVFVNTRNGAEKLAQKMRKTGFGVSCTHGSLEQAERDRLMDEFRQCKSNVLVTTDLFARGIDVQTCNFVINYDLPVNPTNRKTINKQVYLHRVGRCARSGRKGTAVSLITDRELEAFQSMARKLNIDMKVVPKNLPVLTQNL